MDSYLADLERSAAVVGLFCSRVSPVIIVYMKHGYTIAESLAVLFIMATVGVLLLANFGVGREQQKLKKIGLQTLNAIREAQTHALAGTSVGATNGYGVFFHNNEYYFNVFASRDQNYVYNLGVDQRVNEFGQPAVNRLFEEDLRPQLRALCSGSMITPTYATIFFAPPHPVTHLNRGISPTFPCEAICVNFIRSDQKTIHRISTIKNSGVIEVVEVPYSVAELNTCP